MAASNRSQIGQESSKTSRSDKPRRRRFPLAGMGCRWFAECALLLLMFCTAPALVVCAADVDDPVPGKNGPQRRGADRDDTDIQFQRKARALPSRDSHGEERDQLWRIRIETPDGVFLIYDVAIPATEPGETGGYVAYWGDSLEETLYLYNQLLLDSIDVGHALVNLSRDLLIDVSAMAASDPWLQEAFLDALEDAPDPTVWIRPVQSGIARPKGFIPATDRSDGDPAAGHDGAENLPCPVGQSSVCIYDLDGNETCSCVLAPVRCLGACCTLDCDDGEVCTTDGCAFGACFHAPNTLPCAEVDEDDDACTNDVCVNGTCTHPDKDCVQELADEIDNCTEEEDIYCVEGLGCFRDWRCDDGDPCNYDWCCLDENGLFSPALCPSDQGQANCYHDPMWPFHDVAVLCPNVSGCIGIITVPGHDYVALNNDDDNRNNTLDYLEEGEVAGENDLVPVDLNFASCMGNCEEEPPADSWQLHLLFSPGVLLYFDPVRLSRVNTLGGAYPYPAPSRVFMEGRQLSTECGGPIVGANAKAFTPGDGVNICCFAESVPVRVVKVTSLEWEPYREFDINNVDLGTCPINGGRRIFTGKIDPSDTHPTQRKYVTLVATVKPPIAGVQVYFKVWDVDDPFDQLYGPLHRDGVDEVPGVSTLDPGNDDRLGIDNRGGSGGLTGTAVTDSDGKARKTFHTSRQPGDNYRAAATCLKQLLDNNAPNPQQVDQATADALSVKIEAGKYVPNGEDSGYKLPVVWSKMLTVWRKLHVETDTMVRPTFVQNTFTMNWDNPRQGPVATQVVFDVQDPPVGGGHTDDGQFNGGFVEISNGMGVVILTKQILDYVTKEGLISNPPDEVTVNIPDCGNGQSGLACLGGVTSGTAILSDDDLSVQATFAAKTWGCNDTFSGPVASLAPPDLGRMAQRYNLAYIEPVHDTTASAVQGLVTFLQNQSFGLTANYGKALWDQSLAARNLPVSTTYFWTVMVVTAWQEGQGNDYDPNSEIGDGSGVVLGINTHSDGSRTAISQLGAAYTGNCTIFKAVFAEAGMQVRERFTVVHEIGHTLGLAHSDGGLMCAAGDCQTEPFTAISLKKLRDYVSP